MSLLLQIEEATGQVISSIETSPAITEAVSALGKDISSIFPAAGQAIESLDDIITAVDGVIHEITAQNASTVTTYGPSDEKPVTALSDQEKALIAKLSHVSATNEAGQQIIKFLEPIAQETANVAQASVTKLEEISSFLKAARNQEHTVAAQPAG